MEKKEGILMMPFVAGTVRNAVKMTAMDNKWQQRKSELTKSIREKYGDSEQAKSAMQYLHYQIELEQIREGNHQAEIDAKIRSGAPLTPEELEYLKEKNPKAYQTYEEAKKEEKAYEKQLESCDTKEDVEKLEHVKMGEFLAQLKDVANNPRIPESAKLAQIEKIHAKAKLVQKVHEKFVKSSAYAAMPTEEEKREKENKDGNSVKRSDDGDRAAERERTDTDFPDNDADEEFVKKEDAGQENSDNRSAEVRYQDVAETAKEIMLSHRPAGAGLGMLLDIEEEQGEKRKF